MHVKHYSTLVGNIFGHTMLLAMWLAIEVSFEHWVVPLFPIETPMFQIAFMVARLLFLLTPLTFIVIWMRRDIICAWYGTQREIAVAQAAAECKEDTTDESAGTRIRIPLGEERQEERQK